uniref:Histone deacetylase domain-containing protein n=1 Tax=Chelydra serpentina TaxID=8475 RepID=A0A8C3SEZ9_CHESE
CALSLSQEYLELMKSTEQMNEQELRALSETYDSVFLHPDSYRCARLAGGCVLRLLEKVESGELRNGLALVRPPGHHAHRDKMDGYCMFNHLAIGARYARQKLGVERVLIVDWDVHHGQGTQFLFEEDPSVLYFSVHRYEQGRFWPHLPASDSPAVGQGRGEGFNINVPWNAVGMRDGDYLAAFLHVLLPVAFEVSGVGEWGWGLSPLGGECGADPRCRLPPQSCLHFSPGQRYMWLFLSRPA